MGRPWLRVVAFAVVLVATPSCALILGDDFKITDDDGASSGKSASSGGGCDTRDNCDACMLCECSDVVAACQMGSSCYEILLCVSGCPGGCVEPDTTCSDCVTACEYDGTNPKPQLGDVFAFANCACNSECSGLCAGIC